MNPEGRFLLTSNVLINYLIGKRNPDKIYPYFVQSLISLCQEESVIFYMTDFDFMVAFVLTMTCGYNQNPSVLSTLNEIASHINLIEINENILETASILSIHPPDAVRVGAATEHGLDGIITWDFTHFQSQQDLLLKTNVSGTTVWYIGIAEDGDSSVDSYIELDVYSVNEFFNYLTARFDESQPNQFDQIEINKQLPHRLRLFSIQYRGEVCNWKENWTWVKVEIQLDKSQFLSGEADGQEGLIHTTFRAINSCLEKHFSDLPFFETTITIPPLPRTAGLGEAIIELVLEEQKFIKKSYRNDFVSAVASAYLDAVADLLQVDTVVN